MSFGSYVKTGFQGCRLIAEAFDEYRKRRVNIYLLPCSVDHVGVSDGTDAWIAPVVADPFNVKIQQLINDVRSGKQVTVLRQPEPKDFQRGRRVLKLNDTPSPRRKLNLEPSPPQRRRVNV